jgi:hypothetical protein
MHMHISRPTQFFVFELDSTNVQVLDEDGNVFIQTAFSYDDAVRRVRARLKTELDKDYLYYKWILYPHSVLQIEV